MARVRRRKPYSAFEHDEFMRQDAHAIHAQREFSRVQMLAFYDTMPKMVRDIAKDDTRAIRDYWDNLR